MSLRRLVFFSSLFLRVLTVAPLVQTLDAEGFQPISLDELKVTSEPQAPGAPAIILDREVNRDDRGLTAHEDDYYRIKILKEEGRKYADIEIPYFNENGNKIINLHARTIRPDGSTTNFDGKIFDKVIEKSKGFRLHAKTLTLPDVQPGNILEYYYTVDLPEHEIINSRWILSEELFTKHARFSLKPYTSNYSNWHVRWSWRLLPQGTAPPQEGPDHVIRMETSNIPAFQLEDYMPPPDELKSRVDFTYTEEFEAKDAAQFWKNYSKKHNGYVEGFVSKPKAMGQAVNQIVGAADSADMKIQKIYARVQQLHNLSYELLKTAQEEKREKEKENQNVEDVWKRGYGTRAELNWLFLALARAAGFEAYPVYASDRRNYFFNAAMMDTRKLDVRLVLVKVNDKDVFCDPGSPFTPYGLLMWQDTAVPGLRLDKEGGTWIQTVLPQSSASRVERKAELTLSNSGDLEGKLIVTFTGLEALRWRREEQREDDTDRKKALEEHIQHYIPAACDIELTNKPDWTGSSAPLVAEFTVKIPGWASAAGRRTLLPVGILSASEKRVFEQEQRVHPIYFEFPYQKEDDIIITLPAGWSFSSLPKEQTRDAKAALYSLKVEGGSGTLHLTRKIDFDLVILDQKYYPALRNFFQIVRTGDEEQVVLQSGAASASN